MLPTMCHRRTIVDDNKRTIVHIVEIKTHEGIKLLVRGIAKCLPDDEFNIHFGSKLAIAKAMVRYNDQMVGVYGQYHLELLALARQVKNKYIVELLSNEAEEVWEKYLEFKKDASRQRGIIKSLLCEDKKRSFEKKGAGV